MMTQKSFYVAMSGRGMSNITADIAKIVSQSKIIAGLCNVFIHHTSASLILCENADPDVQHDLEVFMGRLVSDGDSIFRHVAEGPDDMSAHVRTILTQSSLMIPVTDGKLDLGTWQGVFLWEHRLHQHSRRVTVSILGN